MAEPASSLRARVVSALVMVPLAVGVVVLGGWSFAALVAVAVVLMGLEWSRLSEARFGRSYRRASGAVAVVAGLLATVLAALGRPLEAVGCVAIGAALAAGIAWRRAAAAWAGIGVALIGLPAVALIWLRAVPDVGLALMLWLLIVVWSTDTAAYFVGGRVGGPRLAPAISPGKTWSGLGGGIVGAALASAITAWVVGSERLVQAAGLGALIALLAQGGDLVESRVKRSAGVKDSGGLIPGHGGVLDRLDGLLITAPIVALIGVLLGPRAWPWP